MCAGRLRLRLLLLLPAVPAFAALLGTDFSSTSRLGHEIPLVIKTNSAGGPAVIEQGILQILFAVVTRNC
jgi:hypothetical protein